MLTGGGIALCAELVSRAASPAPKVKDLPVAQFVEVFNAHLCAAEIIHGYIALRHLAQVLADEHRRDPAEIRVQLFVALHACGRKKDPVDLPSDHQFKKLALQLRIPGRIAQNDIISPGTGLPVDVICQLRHEGVIHAGDDQPQQFGAFLDHGASDCVYRIVHLLADLKNTTACLLADLRTSGECAGNSGIGDAGSFCNVFDRNIFHGN